MAAAEDLLSETHACDLLARLFRGRGYKVSRNIPFREYGVSFHIDGWDAKARVGFEFLTSEDEDHDDLTLDEYKTLMEAQQRGELALFVIDEVEPLSEADLTYTVNEFLDEVAAAARGSRKAKRPTLKKATTKAAKAAAKPAAKKAKPKASRPAAATKAAVKPSKAKPRVKQAAGAATQKARKKGATNVVKKSSTKVAKKAAKKRAR